MTIKIEKNITIPDYPRVSKFKKYIDIFNEMKPGDSIVVSTLIRENIRQAVIKKGFKIVTRKIGANKHRIWCV